MFRKKNNLQTDSNTRMQILLEEVQIHSHFNPEIKYYKSIRTLASSQSFSVSKAVCSILYKSFWSLSGE